MKRKILNAFLIVYLIPLICFASENHNSSNTNEEHEEENSSVGLSKGILEVKDRGFKLSPEAIKTISFKTVKIESNQFVVRKSFIMFSKGEKKLYRLRDGFIKSVDFSISNTVGENIKVFSNEFKKGDELIIFNIGHIRVAEMVALGGNEVGHSH